MIESDTIKLLRECDAGIKMGIESINEVLKYVDDSRLHDVLTKCRDDHLGLQAQIQEMLDDFMIMEKSQTLLQKVCHG